jgi:hypothetical protein
MKKINLYLIALILGLALIGVNNAKAAKVEPCMTQTCVDYFNKWKKMSYRKYNTALSVLGELYYQGYGTEKNLDKSFELFKKAARYNFTYAQYRTGLFYLSEEGYTDTDHGIKFLKKAARNGHVESAFLLALSYGTGELTEKDTQESDKWLEKAINGKHSKAQMYASFLNQNEELTHSSYPKVSTMIQLLSKEGEVIGDEETTEQLTQSKLVKNQGSINWPEDSSMEIIQISAPTVEAIFDNELAYLRINPPASNGATGTRITGRTCDQMVSCNAVDRNDFERLIMQLWQ